MDNIINAVFGAQRDTRTERRYQWNTGQLLRITGPSSLPDAFEVHIANEGDAEAARMIYAGEPVSIDDKFFQSGRDILAWVYLQSGETGGTTILRARIPIVGRARPVDYEPSPQEKDILQQAIALLNRKIADIEDAAQNAAAAREAAGTATQAAESATSAATAATQAAESATSAATAATGAASSAAQSSTAAREYAEDAERHSFSVTVEGDTLVFENRKG